MAVDECMGLFKTWIETRRAFSAYLGEVMPRHTVPSPNPGSAPRRVNEPEMLARRAGLQVAQEKAKRAYDECVERGWAGRP